MDPKPLISLRHVHKRYPEGGRLRSVLRDLSLEVCRGESVAILGPSGCGKSTLLNLLAGIDRADDGIIEIGGHRLEALAEAERTRFRRRHVGFVFQFFNLIPTLTVEENVRLPLELNGAGEDASRARARELLGRVDLTSRAGTFPDRLSGGEQQRVALIRALAHRPVLVLADEPTGNLDEETGAVVLDLLLALPPEQGTTVIMVTHGAEAARRAGRVLHMSQGRLGEASP